MKKIPWQQEGQKLSRQTCLSKSYLNNQKVRKKFKVQGKGEKTGATETVIPAMLRGYTGLLPTIILTC